MPKACPNCGTRNEDIAVFCDQCGSRLAPGGMPGSAPGAGVRCPACGAASQPGMLFCDQCGASLARVAPAPMPPPVVPPQPSYAPPQSLPESRGFQPPPVPTMPSPAPPAPSTPGGQSPTSCHLMIGGKSIPIPQKTELVVGRADAGTGWTPDVDLTPAGGTPDSGVSRKHVKLIWQGAWLIEDLGSANGTYLCGQRLAPQQRTRINNGETFQLGKLQVTFVAE